MLFELSSQSHADSLFHRLDGKRNAWTDEDGNAWYVGADLGRADDLAVLLRDVERWVAERGLAQIRFSLDGREYELRRPPGPLGTGADGGVNAPAE